MPQFRILGPLEAFADDGTPISLGGPRQRCVLAVLLLRAGEVVSTDSLIDAVWGDHPPPKALNSLHNFIATLRKQLGPSLVIHRPPGYVLATNGDSIDLHHFERLVREATGREPAERAQLLSEALALWRGDPLAEVAFEPFAQPEVRRLVELRLRAVEDWIDAELESNQHDQVIPRLESLVAQFPDRERLLRQLMLALYRAGRQADATTAYHKARRILDEEYGLEPTPQLQQLYAAILRQEAGLLHPDAAAASPEEHIEQVAALLLEGRVVPVFGSDVTELASGLAARFEYPSSEPCDLARVAQYVALTKGSGPLYEELIALLEAGSPPTALHRFFAALPPLLRERGVPHQLLVTSCYDLALEQAFLDAGEEFDVVSYIAVGPDRGRFRHLRPDGATQVIDVPNTYATELSLEQRTVILKLHGGIELESFVITEDDYIGYGDVGSAVPVALAAKLRRSHFLFLGYAMRDWNLRLVLGRIWGADGVSWRSWAVQPNAKSLEREFWRARAVDLLQVQLTEYAGALGRFLGVTRGIAQ